MKKVLIAYLSRTGKTEKMAEYIAEGIRFKGNTADLFKVSEIKNEEALEGYDAYVFGCPTYHRDITEGMKIFLFSAQKADLTGKMGGAFSSYTHSGESAQMIFDTMEHVFKMDMVNLGPLNMKEHAIDTPMGCAPARTTARRLDRCLANPCVLFDDQKEDIMKVPQYVSVEEVRKVCKQLKISDWTFDL